MWEYLYESSIWSLGGLAVGYTLGRTEREVRGIKRTLEEQDDGCDDT